MVGEMVARLAEVIEKDPRSANRISTEAGLGRNYVRVILEEGKSPRMEQLDMLLQTLSSKDALYVLSGIDGGEDDLVLLRLLSRMDVDTKRKAIAFFQSLLPPETTRKDNGEPTT